MTRKKPPQKRERPEPPEERGPIVSRRQAGGMALLAGLAFAGYHWFSGESSAQTSDEARKNQKEIEDSLPNVPITQDQVNFVYRKLYDYLAAEKEKAGNKPFTILIGEVHTSRNSLLLELITADIAHRLGVQDMMVERDDRNMAILKDGADNLLGERDKLLATTDMSGMSDKKKDIVKSTPLIPIFADVPHDPKIRLEKDELSPPNELPVMTYTTGLGFNTHAVDPYNSERGHAIKTDIARATDPKFEIEMTSRIAKITHAKKSSVGMFGASHIPKLAEMLEASGIHAVALDCNAGLSKRMLQFKSTNDPQLNERLEQLQECYQPALESRFHPDVAEALTMMLKASIRHRQLQGELDGAEAKTLADQVTAQAGKSASGGR